MRRFALFLLIFPAFALLQLGFVAPQGDADAILEASKAKIKAVQDLSASFTIELANPAMNNPVTQEGSFKYKNGMYALQLDGQEIYCDKNKTWVYINEVNEVEVSDYNPEDAQNIESIFQLYETNANTRYDGAEKVGGSTCDKIFLAIKGGDLDYNQAYLFIERKSKLPRKVVLIDRRQTRTTYVFSEMETNQGLSPSAFRFDEEKHPGVDVINL